MLGGSYLLIHGGGSTGRFWDRLVPLLDRPSLAIDMPGRRGKPGDLPTQTVEDEVESIVADVHAADLPRPIVVVAHSSGGLTVPGVLRALEGEVGHVVLNAASVPPEGGSGLDCMQARHADGVRLALDMAKEAGEPLLTPGPPADPEAFRTSYGVPLSDDDLAFVVDPERCVVDTMNHYLQPISWATAPVVPVTYVVNLRDRPIPTELQREMIARLPHPPAVIELDGGHIPAITDPEVFAAIVMAVEV